jgi:hypothetical protein
MAIDLDDVIKRVREQLGPPPSDLADLDGLHSSTAESLLSVSAQVDNDDFGYVASVPPMPEAYEPLLVQIAIDLLLRDRCEARNNDGSPCRYRKHPAATPYCRVHWPTRSRSLTRRGEL